MAESNFTGPVESDNGLLIGEPGVAGSAVQLVKTITAIVDSTATTLFTLTIPNVANSAVIQIIIRSGITAASHIYDSTRVVVYYVVVTRVPGAAAVITLSAAVGAQISTSSGGQTLTTTLSAAAVSGGNTATQTCALQITNAGSVATTTETQAIATLLNGAGVNSIGSSGPSGVTIA